MTHTIGTATGVVNFLDQLVAFALANGWAIDDPVGAQTASISRGTVFVSFSYAATAPTAFGIYQSLSYDAANPGGKPDDSGNGFFDVSLAQYTNANIISGRRLFFETSGAIPYFAFFEFDTYIHCVVEIATGKFRHFGFGITEKVNNWTGGEYAYGQVVIGSSGSSIATEATALLDSLALSNLGYVGTLHVEGLPGAPTGSKWGLCCASTTGLGDDRQAGTPRARVMTPGGFRGGPYARGLGTFSAGSQSGKVPMYPIAQWYRDLVSGTGIDIYLLGYMPDVRGVNIREIAPKDEVVIGGDTWIFYPTSQKDTTGAVIGASFVQGIAYKKVLA